MGLEQDIRAHYSGDRLAEKILAAIGMESPSPRDLNRYDEFHIGGRKATMALFDAMGLHAGMRILDIGSGLGGAARCAAEHYNAHVTGIDLTPEYCAAAIVLSAATGMAERTAFQVASALALPFAAGSFDAAYTIHTAMNIPDKHTLYSEAARVLQPGGVFALYDVIQGAAPGAPDFPLPWARDSAASFLATQPETLSLLGQTGFETVGVEDCSAAALTALEQAKGRGFELVAGADFGVRIANLAVAIGDSRCAVWRVVARKI